MQTRSQHIPVLDGFRVLLVFLVSWFHIWQQSWWTPSVGRLSLDFLVRAGYVFVDGTILLSGFLLMLPYARAHGNHQPLPDTRRFYERRIMRILPSYYADELILLFVVALPLGQYSFAPYMVKDLFTHATLTFTFWRDTYLGSPIGGACWTLAIEAQAYLLFPFLARRVLKKPMWTLPLMALTAWAFRAWCMWGLTDYQMVVNQLPAFLDVYAIGMGLAWLVVMPKRISLRPGLRGLLALLLLVGSVAATVYLLKRQARSPSFAEIQRGQMQLRFPLAISLSGCMLGMMGLWKPLRCVFGNPVMHFLSSISLNYYLLHQPIAVALKRWGIPHAVSEKPNTVGEWPWQWQYTFLCFGIALAMATLLTYAVEKPAAKLLGRWFDRRRTKAEAA